MAYCTVEDLRKFSGVTYDDDLQQGFIDTASDIINDYIGYDAHYGSFTEAVDGTGRRCVFLSRPNIESVTKVFVDGAEINIDEVKTSHCMIVFTQEIQKGIKNVEVKYKAGFKEIPTIFKQVNVEIANLIQTMADNNIGITSRSSIDGSRTFIQNTNYDKYLRNLGRFKN